MTDAETTQAVEALAHRIRQRDSEAEHEADAEVFALEFMTALRGRGWRPTSAKTTAPPLHAEPLPDKPSGADLLAAVRADMDARRAGAARGTQEATA